MKQETRSACAVDSGTKSADVMKTRKEYSIPCELGMGGFVHYTPETLDAKTLAVIDAIKKNALLPKTPEVLDATIKKLSATPYEEFSATYPKFSDEYNVDSFVDKNGWKTLKLTYKGDCGNNLPEANLIYIHGGGFLFNFSTPHTCICERLARQMNFTVYIPLYPLAPNYYVQTSLDMLLELYKKVKTEGKPVYLMGDSAGGNLMFGFGLYLKEQKEPLPDALFGISPLCDFSVGNPQLPEYNKRDLMLTMALMHEVRTHWKPETMPFEDFRVSPQFGDWTGMPPVHIFIGTDDSLYPENIETAQNMRKAGVRVGMLIGNHLFHIAPLFPIPVMDQYFDEITAFLYGKR